MGVKVTSLKLGNEMNSLTYGWLKANRGEKIPIEMDFEVSTSVKIFSGNQLTYAPDDFVTLDYIQSEFDLFEDLYTGDTIKITDTSIPANSGTYTILEKVDNSNLRLSTTFANALSNNAIIEVLDVVDKIKFNWNLIENDAAVSFLSLTDNNMQQANANSLDASSPTVVPLAFNGEKSWQIGELNIEGVAIETTPVYKSKFKMTGDLYLTPFFLSQEWDDLLNNIQPEYFLDLNCLKFIYRIEASYVARNPQIAQIIEVSEILGESGGWGENFDLAASNYTKDSFVVENTAVAIPSIQLVTTEQDFEIVVKNTTDSPFDASSNFTLNFVIAPENESEYQNNGQTLDYNFRFDRLINTVGDPSVDGEQFGVSNRQVWKDVIGTLNSSSQITISGKIALNSALVTYLKTLDNPRYIVWVGVGSIEANGGLSTFTFSGQTYNAEYENGDGTAGSASVSITTTAATYVLELYSDPGLTSLVATSTIPATSLNVTGLNPNTTYYIALVDTGPTVVFSTSFATGSADYTKDDRASVLIDAADFYQPLADDGDLLQIVTEGFVPHTSNSISGAVADAQIKSEDEVVAYKRIKIDLSASEYDLNISSIRTGIRLKNTVTNQFNDMDSVSDNFAGAPIVNGLEFIDSVIPRSFKMPETELAKKFKFKRDIAADSGTNRFYDLCFPFLTRWEYWEKFIGLNPAFFDIALPNDGLNNKWADKDTIANWSFFHFVELTFLINGQEHTITKELEFPIDDYDDNADWDNKTIKTYDENNNELVNGGDKYILGYGKTKVVVQAEWIGFGTKSLSDVEMLFRLEPFEDGGRFDSTRLSSVSPSGNESQWFFVTSDEIVVTNPSANVFVGTAYIDSNKLQGNSTFSITARIFDKLGLHTPTIDTISGFSAPKDGCYCTPKNTVYITSNGSNFLKEVDCSDNSIVDSIDLGGISQGIIYNPKTTNYPKGVVYVGVGNSVKAINCNNNTIIETYSLTNSPVNMEFDTEFERLYIVKLSTSVVDILDATGLTLAPSSTITAGNTPSGIAYYANVGLFSYKMYITNYGPIANSVTVVDCAGETVLTTITGITRGYGCVIDQPNNELYVMQATINKVKRINCLTDAAIAGDISVGVSPLNGVYHEKLKMIFVTNIGDDSCSIISTQSKLLLNTFPVGDDPFGVDYCTENESVYLTNNTDNTLQEITLNFRAGEVFKEDFKALRTSSSEPPTLELQQGLAELCCFQLKVFADSESSDTLKNDFYFAYFGYGDGVTAVTLKLFKNNVQVATLNNNTYGEFYAYGFHDDGKKKYIGYYISWKLVLAAFGSGEYFVRATQTLIAGGPQNEDSFYFCLQQYTEDKAQGTVRIDFFHNGIIGDYMNDSENKSFDYSEAEALASGLTEFKNQFRLPKAAVLGESTPFIITQNQYTNGKKINVKMEQNPEYELLIHELPYLLIKYLRTEVLTADDIYITEYNKYGVLKPFILKNVIFAGNVEPEWQPRMTDLASLTLKFEQKNNNLRKRFC